MKKFGKVFLVGAGPGDPGLMTVKGIEVLKKADVIFYDYLANRYFLTEASSKCRKIYVGKKTAERDHGFQNKIEESLIKEARRGKIVVRLKGGDPFIFGRGGEEALALQKARIDFEIIPGVSSLAAVPAYAGIPLTHRELASEFVVITGHLADTKKGKKNYNWASLATIQTIIIFMGRANLALNMRQLIAHGRDRNTPAAIISWGTYPSQKTLIGTIGTLAQESDRQGIRPPTIVVVGDVVMLRKKLKWIEKKPLFGKTVVLTRAQKQTSHMKVLLEEKGAHVIEMPVIEIVPPKSFSPLDSAIRQIKEYNWLMFTSVNAIGPFWSRLEKLKKDARDLSHLKIAVVGAATNDGLKTYGVKANLIPKTYQAEGVIAEFKKRKIKNAKILLPRAKEGREILVDELMKLGHSVKVVPVYQTITANVNQKSLKDIFLNQKPNWILFASSSAVNNFVKIVGKKNVRQYLKKTRIACIGPITRKTARDHKLKITVMPKRSTMPDLVEALCHVVS